jgi:hypothetical protein
MNLLPEIPDMLPNALSKKYPAACIQMQILHPSQAGVQLENPADHTICHNRM